MPSMHDYLIGSQIMSASSKVTPPEGYGTILAELGKAIPLVGYGGGRGYDDKLFDPVQRVVDRLRDLNPSRSDRQHAVGLAARLLYNQRNDYERN